MNRLEQALYWYERAAGNMANRYQKIVGTPKQEEYAKILRGPNKLSIEVDLVAKEFIDGKKDLREFKMATRDWFMEVKERWDKIDSEK